MSVVMRARISAGIGEKLMRIILVFCLHRPHRVSGRTGWGSTVPCCCGSDLFRLQPNSVINGREKWLPRDSSGSISPAFSLPLDCTRVSLSVLPLFCVWVWLYRLCNYTNYTGAGRPPNLQHLLSSHSLSFDEIIYPPDFCLCGSSTILSGGAIFSFLFGFVHHSRLGQRGRVQVSISDCPGNPGFSSFPSATVAAQAPRVPCHGHRP